MRRLALLLALVLAAPAAAAPLGEVPSIAAAGAGTCLMATGVPGELAHDAGGFASDETTLQLLRAGPAGLAPAGTGPLGRGEFACAAVVARPDGTGLAAGTEVDGLRGHIVVAARPAGGAFAAPQAVAATAGPVQNVTAALSASGDAVVAWLEERRTGLRLRAVLRRAGGGFGRPIELASGRAPLEGVTAAMSAGGDAVVAWSRVTAGYQLPYHVSVYAALASGHGPFAPPRRVGETPSGGPPSLAMDDEGRALLALPGAGVVRVAERPPGGRFGAPVAVARPRGGSPPETAVALGAGGRAAIAWESYAGGAGVATRAGAGPFGPPTVLAPARRHVVESFRIEAGGAGPSLGVLEERPVAVTLTPAGTLVAWLGPRRVAGAATTGVRTALLPASGGPVERAAFGGGLRDATTLATFATADDALGVAWLEPAPDGRARLHAALPGGQRPADAPAPAVRIGRPRSRVLRYGRPLLLPVTCSAACDVRAQAAAADGGLSLAHAGHGLMRVQPFGRPLAPVRGGLVRLRVLSGAPGATRPAVRTVALRLRLHALPSPPRPRGLRAVRLPGDRIRVTWFAAGPRGIFLVWGEATRGGPPLVFNGRAESRGRLAVTLHHARGVRFVVLRSYTTSGRPGPTLVARVR